MNKHGKYSSSLIIPKMQIKIRYHFSSKLTQIVDFSVVRTLCSIARFGRGLTPGQGTKIP